MRFRIPLKITVPPVLTKDDEARVRSVVARATADALDALQGQGASMRGSRILLSFSGDEHPGAAHAVRRGVEDAVATPVGEVARLRRRVRARGELLDPDRWDAASGLYRLPSYDEHGEHVAVAVANEPDPTGIPTAADVERRLRARHGSGNPYPGFYGAIAFPDGGTRVRLVWLDPSSGSEEFVLDQIAGLSVERNDQHVTQGPRRASWPSNSHVTLAYQGPITEAWVRTRVQEALAAVRASGAEVPPGREDEVVRSVLDSQADKGILSVDAPSGRNTILAPPIYRNKVIQIEVGNTDVPLETGGGEGLGSGGDGDGAGTGRGGDRRGTSHRGSRRRGGPLGDENGAEDGSTWPTADADGDPLECEAFGDEQTVQVLPSEARRQLWAEMERLARMLEVPICPYAGNFALMLASAIGARARGVGLAARDRPGRTRVELRPEGGGNNGVVDIQAEQTPGLAYMHTLAAIVPEVLTFGRMVAGTYEGLGRDVAVEYPDHWSIDFYVELGRRLEASCAYLFAETCRVILLQQLASTKEIIAHRRGAGFEDTRSYFESALGTLGERIVTVELLQRALRRARELGYGGPAREVLSDPDPRADIARYGGNYSPPGPIVPAVHDAHLLALVDDATVTGSFGNYRIRWNDREWTHDELDQQKQFRRAFLNRADPLFLQIEDLRAVYARVRRDGNARAYLEELLDEIRRANEAVTEQAKDADDGHWFAVETSQYVEAEGGATRLGTRYEMHGIHGLADQELRPNVGIATFQYNRGADRAIGRKAGLDTLKAIFETGAVLVLGIVCAPLGAVAAGAIVATASIGFAVNDLLNAADREELYHALEDPEQILSWQEVQLEWTMAMVGAAFSIFDVVDVGRALKAGLRGMRATLREGMEQGLRHELTELLRQQMRRMLKEVAEGVFEHAIRAAVTQLVIQTVMNEALPVVVRPVVVSYMHDIAVEHGLGVDVEAVLDGREDTDALRVHAVHATTAADAGGTP